MATVNYSLLSRTSPARVYCRLVHTRAIDFNVPLNITMKPANWDKRLQKVRNVNEEKNRDEINHKLGKLKVYVMDQFNLAIMEGEIIDRQWLIATVSKFFNRPAGEKNNKNKAHTIYYTDFANWWIKERSSSWLVGNNGYMNEREKGKYEAFIAMVEEFQGKDKIKLRDVTSSTIMDFVNHLHSNSYSAKTISRHVSRYKFFCSRAEEEEFTVNKSYKGRVFVPKSVEIKEPYLSINEIKRIYMHDFSKNEHLDNVRDNLIIACSTGLRVSDFLKNLDLTNFIDDYIEITTQKTKTPVVIPVHPMVKKILIKRNGRLPNKISDVKFNVSVKEVCRLSGLTEKMEGSLYDSKKKRKVKGTYFKYELVSSHIGRRSFATNHYGKVSTSVIMAICGWSKEDMMLKYIKKHNKEHAVELQRYWEEQQI